MCPRTRCHGLRLRRSFTRGLAARHDGRKRSSKQELEELNIVVDISRDDRLSGKVPASISRKKLQMEDMEIEHSSSSTACSSEGTQDTVDATTTHDDKDDEDMEYGHDEEHMLPEEQVKQASKIVLTTKSDEKPSVEASSTENGGPRDGRIITSLPHDIEGTVKQRARKRKKTIHYMNSRVPHSIPTLDSDEGSESPERPEDAEEMPVRLVHAPRAAASKLKAMVPVGDKLLKPPRNAKELMATGLLEGHYVRCTCRGEQLTGILQDMGVVCNCRICKGDQVVSISAFEAHSGSTSHHPSDNIYLENGKNLRDILSAGQEAADCGDNILRALKHAIGEIQGVMKRKAVCTKCGGPESGKMILCKGARCSSMFHPECVGVLSSHRGDWFCATCEKPVKKPLPLPKAKRPVPVGDREEARSREKDATVSARSARDAHLHKSLFLPGGLQDGTELGYYARNQCILKGVKKGGGICCSCCKQEISCSAFEQHAGCEARRNPYGSILLTDGRSLKDLCKELADQNKLGESTKRVAWAGETNSCIDCGDRGNLSQCQGCDLAWCHDCAEETSDLGLENQVNGEWYCRTCQKDNIPALKNAYKPSSRRVDANVAAPDDRGRHIRHLEAHNSGGGCAICKKWNMSKSGFDVTMLVCNQCGREYHVGCLRESGMDNLNELPEGEWFCQKDCEDIYDMLGQMVAKGSEPLSDSILSRLLECRQQQGSAKELAESSSPFFTWQIFTGRGEASLNNQTLSEAVEIFMECSDRIRDATSGQNLIPLMVCSQRSGDYDFDSIFCVVLKLNGKVVSTALLQIFGRQIAEVLLVATSPTHRKQGFCKALMRTIERQLRHLGVERLVLPTAKDTEPIWMNKFGFTRMEDAQLSKFQSTLRLMTFTGTGMLEKPLSSKRSRAERSE